VSTFREAAKLNGHVKLVEEITFRGLKGEIDWREGLIKRIDLLKGLSYRELVETAEKMQVREDAYETVQYLKKMGLKVGVISGGFTIFIDPLKERLKLDFAVANELIFTDGRLTGVKINVDNRKHLALLKVAKRFRVPLNRVVMVADGANDLTALRMAGLSIGFNPQKIVEESVSVTVRSDKLKDILPFIKAFYSEKHKLAEVKSTTVSGVNLKPNI